jgi:hypothetical protein
LRSKKNKIILQYRFNSQLTDIQIVYALSPLSRGQENDSVAMVTEVSCSGNDSKGLRVLVLTGKTHSSWRFTLSNRRFQFVGNPSILLRHVSRKKAAAERVFYFRPVTPDHLISIRPNEARKRKERLEWQAAAEKERDERWEFLRSSRKSSKCRK